MTQHRNPTRITTLTATGILATAAIVGCGRHQDDSAAPTQDQKTQAQKTLSPHDAAHALEQLQQLPVTAENGADYRRAAFGKGWKDLDGNGCSTRNEILARDLKDTHSSDGCTITSGILDDPYTGQRINFTRGEKSSQAVQIDHQVPLSQAWASGARDWDKNRRVEFANDPENLLAVDGSANQAKQDQDAAQWLPKNADYQCTYISHQVSIKAKYGLSVDQREHDILDQMLHQC